MAGSFMGIIRTIDLNFDDPASSFECHYNEIHWMIKLVAH